jgi:hypothetical protein
MNLDSGVELKLEQKKLKTGRWWKNEVFVFQSPVLVYYLGSCVLDAATQTGITCKCLFPREQESKREQKERKRERKKERTKREKEREGEILIQSALKLNLPLHRVEQTKMIFLCFIQFSPSKCCHI